MRTNQLFNEIGAYFLDEPKLAYARLFAKHQRQVEGWFKGELIWLFSSLQDQGLVSAWASEADVPGRPRQKVDFMVRCQEGPVYLELKTLYHGRQRNSLVDLGLYFLKDDVGIWRDVRKLACITPGIGICLLFVYPSPSPGKWRAVLDRYRQRIAPVGVVDLSEPPDHPNPLYIAKVRVTGNAGPHPAVAIRELDPSCPNGRATPSTSP